MDLNRVTVRYAKAFIELASEQGIIMPCYNDIGVLFASLNNYKGFNELILNPGISNSKKSEQLNRLFGKEFQPLTMKFLELIFSSHREEYIIDICRNCIDMVRRIEGISSANLTTAFDINDELISQIKSKFELETKSAIELTTDTDSSLIGGFIFTIDGEQYDASIASRLSSVKKQLQLK
jgi:F-type H+-transporting ATPase subunit delta